MKLQILLLSTISLTLPHAGTATGQVVPEEDAIGRVFEDRFDPSEPRLLWKFKWNPDEIVTLPDPPADSNSFAFRVGDSYGYDSAYIERATATSQIVEGRIYVDANGRSEFSRMGIFARGNDGTFRGDGNCCFMLTVDSDDGKIRALRRMQGIPYSLPLTDERFRHVEKGWHTLKISAIDKEIAFFADGELVASAVTGECLGNVCAGIYNDAMSNNENRNYTLVDFFRLTELPEEAEILKGLERLMYIKQVEHDIMLAMGLVAEASQSSACARSTLGEFIDAYPDSPLADEALEKLAAWWRTCGMEKHATRIDNLLSRGHSAGEAIRLAGPAAWGPGDHNPYHTAGKRIETVAEFLEYGRAYRQLKRYLLVDVRESLRLGRPPGEVSAIEELGERIGREFKQALGDAKERHKTKLPEEESYQFLVQAAKLADNLGWTDIRQSFLEAAAASSDADQSEGAVLEMARYNTESEQYAEAAELYRRLAAATTTGSPLLNDVYSEWADVLQKRFRYDEAAAACNAFIERYPNHPSVPLMRLRSGRIRYEQREDEEVIRTLEPLLVGDATDEIGFEARMLRGLTAMRLDDYATASRIFAKLSEEAPAVELRANALFLLGYSAVFNDRLSAGREAFEEFLERYPDDPKVEEAGKFLERIRNLEGER